MNNIFEPLEQFEQRQTFCHRFLSRGGQLSVFLLICSLAGCAPNKPFRASAPVTCPGNGCGQSMLEQHPEYDLAFVEFTERGNVFDRQKMQQVLEHVHTHADANDGVTTLVFVHGWKHNADADDTNVSSFEELLRKTAVLGRRAAESASKRPRRVVGIYIGWRGVSLDLRILDNLSYWDRKAVAHQVGKGGVTEFLLHLEQTVIDAAKPNKNLLLVTGHSFGAAIVLSAINEVLLERVVTAQQPAQACPFASQPHNTDTTCVESRPFGHGVVLLNPAIEATEALQLKERVAQTCFTPRQARLMHIISSDADKATNIAFRAGQWLGVNLRWDQEEFTRTLGGKRVRLDESDLDTITVGNFVPFQTGQLSSEAGKWEYISCVGTAAASCVEAEEDKAQHIPVASNEPLAFIHTDSTFIASHNDIFNNHVAAYLATIVAEARSKRCTAPTEEGLPQKCEGKDFDFGQCFSLYQTEFEKL